MNGSTSGLLGLQGIVEIAVAALGGAAIGVERQWSGHASGDQARFGGVRTFTLLGGLAGVSARLWIEGFPATTAACAAPMSRPLRSVTRPPASLVRSTPAAMSQGASISSQNPSNMPAATQQRSSAAEPARRIPDVAMAILANWG